MLNSLPSNDREMLAGLHQGWLASPITAILISALQRSRDLAHQKALAYRNRPEVAARFLQQEAIFADFLGELNSPTFVLNPATFNFTFGYEQPQTNQSPTT